MTDLPTGARLAYVGIDNRARARRPRTSRAGGSATGLATCSPVSAAASSATRRSARWASASIGGGNIATLQAFEDLGRACAVLVAHDLDHDNTRLLRERRLSAVLHHDLRQDVREACHLVMRAHGAPPPAAPTRPSAIQVVRPCNMPTPVR